MISKKVHLNDIKDEGFKIFINDNKQFKILVTPKIGNLKL